MDARFDFQRRAARYEQLDADPRIHGRTKFFRAASVVTRVLGTGRPSCFMARLSASLERVNVTRALRISAGALYVRDSVLANTTDFVHFEQSLVQHALEALHAGDPAQYECEIEAADRGLARISSWYCRFRSDAHGRLHVALRIAGERLGHPPQFARQADRETIGIAIASL